MRLLSLAGSLLLATAALSAQTAPLTVYTGENCTGNNMDCQSDIYYRSEPEGANSFLPEEMIGDFDNAIRSFKLAEGYGCTMANFPDGTGHSQVFIADEGDLQVDVMPEGLQWVSFIRVFKFMNAGKRGIGGGGINDLANVEWYYTWGASDESTETIEFIPMRHNRWWDGWDKIGSRKGSSAVLGYNEPDHTDQSDLSVDYAISEWPNMMKSGLRIGSPAPDCINKDWLVRFIKQADSLNYRVDFVATHMYWNSQDPYKLVQNIESLCKNTYGRRTMWITEWNNGANWTNESWPDKEGPRRDAHFNIVYDENGNTTTVKRPHTQANSAVQVDWLTRALDAFENCPWLERHAFYNAVEDARAIELFGELTPAGEVFANFESKKAYSKTNHYEHTWKIAPPRMLKIQRNKDRVRIDFYDHNGETAAKYIVERRIDKGPWEAIAEIVPETDYKMGPKAYWRDFEFSTNGGYHEYRMKGVSHSGEESLYSRRIGIEVPNTAGVATPATKSGLNCFVNGGRLFIEADTEGTAALVRPDGRVVRNISYTNGTTEVEEIPSGIYIIAGTKVII